jgi:hypothetical protein
MATFLEEMGRTLEEQSRTIYELSRKLREELGLPAAPIRKAHKRLRVPTDPNQPKFVADSQLARLCAKRPARTKQIAPVGRGCITVSCCPLSRGLICFPPSAPCLLLCRRALTPCTTLTVTQKPFFSPSSQALRHSSVFVRAVHVTSLSNELY